ncbi:unnamed protein product [Periconia digitata]|uniref:Uncharacterized protein n=1 Tax=Periconia digitata TaxID=1303443 RepID=A0A9W4U6G4_9PLEO|nr:unnamed protein product [Periconia digitata]
MTTSLDNPSATSNIYNMPGSQLAPRQAEKSYEVFTSVFHLGSSPEPISALYIRLSGHNLRPKNQPVGNDECWRFWVSSIPNEQNEVSTIAARSQITPSQNTTSNDSDPSTANNTNTSKQLNSRPSISEKKSTQINLGYVSCGRLDELMKICSNFPISAAPMNERDCFMDWMERLKADDRFQDCVYQFPSSISG